MVWRVHLSLIVAVFAPLWGCRSREAPSAVRVEQASSSTVSPPLLDSLTLSIEADARRNSADSLMPALAAQNVEERRRAARMLARLGNAKEDTFVRLLRDSDPQVRRWGALGVTLVDDPKPALIERLQSVTAAEPASSEASVSMWNDLGHVATAAALPSVVAAIASTDPLKQEGACLAVGEMGIRAVATGDTWVDPAAAVVQSTKSVGARRACLFALTRAQVATDARERIYGVLVVSTRDGDPEARILAAKALGKLGAGSVGPLQALLGDSDSRVVIQALRALAQRSSVGAAKAFTTALAQTAERVESRAEPFTGNTRQLLYAALEAARPLAQDADVLKSVTDIHMRLTGLIARSGSRSEREMNLASLVASLHCEAALLVDIGRQWPSRVETCGGQWVTDGERARLSAEILGELSGSDEPRGALLAKLYKFDQARVTVVSATAKLQDSVAMQLLLRAMGTIADTALVGVAAEALSKRLGARLVTEAEKPRVQESANVALQALASSSDLEALLSTLELARTVRVPNASGILASLQLHSNVAVRRKAAEVSTALGVPLSPETGPQAITNLIDRAMLSRAGGTLTVLTSRGQIVIKMSRDDAPVTVARLSQLAREGFYNGLTFHRVVPGFVVQGGDPRGDGYGGPGWTQRCENNLIPYERGTVGMALAGRDTGGSQFFFTQSWQPHLTGQYTAFGHVTEGMDVVDSLMPGDRIVSVTVSP